MTEADGLPVLDAQAIDRLMALSPYDPRLLDEVVTLFEESTAADLERIEAGFSRGDAATVLRGAHRMRSAALSVGATALASCCAELDAAGRFGEALDEARVRSLREARNKAFDALTRALR